MTNTKNVLSGASLAAAVAMALAGCANAPPAETAAGMGGTVSCKEANSCKGHATCSGVAVGEKHACKGQNSCAGNLRELTKSECDAIKGTVVASN